MNCQGNPIRSKLKMFREGAPRTDRCNYTASTFSSSMVQQNSSRLGRSKSELKQLLRDKENAVHYETTMLYKRELEYQNKLRSMESGLQDQIDDLHTRLVNETNRNRALQNEYYRLAERHHD
jgi:hypothetical protein